MLLTPVGAPGTARDKNIKSWTIKSFCKKTKQESNGSRSISLDGGGGGVEIEVEVGWGWVGWKIIFHHKYCNWGP